MSGLQPENVALVHEACASNLPAVADSLRQCLRLEEPLAFELGEATDLDEAPERDGLDGPGLVVMFDVGEATMACLVPESFPLPEWYREAGDSESSRLQTLALEWSLNLLPPELEAGRFESRAVDSLAEFVAEGEPLEGAVAADLVVRSEEVEDGTDDPGRWIRLVWPLSAVAQPERDAEPAEERADPPGGAGGLSGGGRESTKQSTSARGRDSARLALIRGLSVPISVRLAEKRIDVSQLLGLTPGALISFGKDCEDPLDLYVNNRRFARGEAVKIGEKFGLKIDEIGNRDERRRRVLDG